ncbi:MAG: general negative regulator of transcription subunit 5 [Caeruleum heppii]|nr:MAG: general negative regulator of transcription subunit 5 [Caeruleum heppii]
MAQRKLQQEVDRCFKRVAEGIQAFEGIFDKIQQTSNLPQKEKLEDALKREIKKLQRQRDQIKTWAASNEIKDKKPLLEQRKLIETQMEKFKAVEKEMKTKAYSKEGLSAAAKLDPREKEKLEACQFLSSMVEELERQVEMAEAEAESLQANMKKGKKDTSKAERIAEIERLTERHKWHQGKLELMLRSLENGGVETDQVTNLEESIRYYVENNQDADFMEDDAIYDDLNLAEDEDTFGIANENDRLSSQDTISVQDEATESEGRGTNIAVGKPKSSSVSEPQGAAAARRPSTHARSPLPALATLHTPSSNVTTNAATSSMKPAPLPSRPPGETLKYASAAAAAAAASDKNSVGIAPLPPPPSSTTTASGVLMNASMVPPLVAGRVSEAGSPKASTAPMAASESAGGQRLGTITAPEASELASSARLPSPSPVLNNDAAVGGLAGVGASSRRPTMTASDKDGQSTARSQQGNSPDLVEARKRTAQVLDQNAGAGLLNARLQETAESFQANRNGALMDSGSQMNSASQSIYHLPPGLQDLVQSFETTKSRGAVTSGPLIQRLLASSHANCPDPLDAEKPRHYKPQTRYKTASHYPQEPLSTLDDYRLYSRIDTDTLFYVFYYRQGTYQQYLAAKALKNQSWRFHKQYQTWFQRHEEPKTITEEYEQGTYRFFDYESTWMNRRKADFKFAYKFLEDDL